MKFITVSELRAQATSIIAEIEATGEKIVVTKHGKPVVLIRRVSSGEFDLKSGGKGKADGKNKGVV